MIDKGRLWGLEIRLGFPFPRALPPLPLSLQVSVEPSRLPVSFKVQIPKKPLTLILPCASFFFGGGGANVRSRTMHLNLTSLNGTFFAEYYLSIKRVGLGGGVQRLKAINDFINILVLLLFCTNFR